MRHYNQEEDPVQRLKYLAVAMEMAIENEGLSHAMAWSVVNRLKDVIDSLDVDIHERLNRLEEKFGEKEFND